MGDGCLYVLDVKDKEGRGAMKLNQKDSVPYAEEVPVTKSDLEEKNSKMTELQTKVEELTMQNDYQMRLKDLTHSDKIKEITEKYNMDLDDQRTKFEVLLQEKNDMEIDYEEKIKKIEEETTTTEQPETEQETQPETTT